jgi:hypothetical protein
VIRVEGSDPAKKVLCIKRGGNRDRRGKPKLRWCDKLEEKIALVGCRIWRISILSREKWWKFIEVKSHPGI